jgi:Cu+-exporting ATPase
MDQDHDHKASDIPAGTETTKGSVCGMTVAVKSDGRHAEFESKTFHFCSNKCQTKFKADPWFYATGGSDKRSKVPPADVQFTYPMHPEIIRDAAGA